MYAFLEQLFKGVYHCARCDQVQSLVVQILGLEDRLLLTIGILKRNLNMKEQALAGASDSKGGLVEGQNPGVSSWATNRKWGRGKILREVSLKLTHPNNYICLHNVGDIGFGVAPPPLAAIGMTA